MTGLGGMGSRVPNDSRYVTSGKIAISWSKAGDTLWGYSSVKGRWSKVKIVPPKEGVLPTVGLSVAVVSTDKHVYAFSNQTGRWGILKGTGVPTVSQDQVLVKTGDEYHIFSDASGQWASQSEAEEQSVPSAGLGGIAPGGVGGMAAGMGEVHGTVRGRGAAMAGMAGMGRAPSRPTGGMGRALENSKGEPISPDVVSGMRGRTAGMMRGSATGRLGVIGGIGTAPVQIVDATGQPITLQDGDGDGELEVVTRRKLANEDLDADHDRILGSDGSPVAEATIVQAKQAIASLKEIAVQSEREAAKVAAEYRTARQRTKEEDPQCAALKSQLVAIVQKAFGNRQNAQRLEAEILRHRLKSVDDRLAERERLKDQITERRIQALLDPALSWESSEEEKK